MLLFAVTGQAETQFSHGVSSFSALKYRQGFAHFDYLNPDAPEGGTRVLATASLLGQVPSLHLSQVLQAASLRPCQSAPRLALRFASLCAYSAFGPAPPSIMEHPPTVTAFPVADVP